MIDVNPKTRSNFNQCIDSPWIKMLTKIDNSSRIDPSRLIKTFT